MSIYYKYAPDGSKLFIFSKVDECVYWNKSEEILKWFVCTLGKILHVNFLGYSHWFILISISQLRDYYISVDQAIYTTSVVVNYLDTETIKENSKFHKTTLPHSNL